MGDDCYHGFEQIQNQHPEQRSSEPGNREPQQKERVRTEQTEPTWEGGAPSSGLRFDIKDWIPGGKN